jgi:hypothetical protein
LKIGQLSIFHEKLIFRMIADTITFCSGILAAGRAPHAGAVWLPIIIVALVAGAIIFGAIVSTQVEKKRTAQLNDSASALGLEFLPSGDAAYLQSLSGMPLMKRGHGKKLWNLMRGQSGSFDVAIFDYKYVTGSGRSSQTWRQTVACFQSPALTLPAFSLAPKKWWNRVDHLLGRQSVEFQDHPEFSGNYVLRGENVDELRALFTDQVLAFFDRIPGWNLEGSANQLQLYKQPKRIPPTAIAEFFETGLQMLSLLRAGS